MIDFIIQSLQSLPSEAISLIMLAVCAAFMLASFRLFGLYGLYVYICGTVIVANIQVLKLASFSMFPTPVALGTAAFTSLYAASNIINEHYGPVAARRAIGMSFLAVFFMSISMVLTMGWSSVDAQGSQVSSEVDAALAILFRPAFAIFLASLIAYGCSQFNDIWVYSFVRRLTGGRFIWLRASCSMALSALLDNFLFSMLAWYFFAPDPLELSVILTSYVLGTYVLRLLMSFLMSPVVAASHRFKPRDMSI